MNRLTMFFGVPFFCLFAGCFSVPSAKAGGVPARLSINATGGLQRDAIKRHDDIKAGGVVVDSFFQDVYKKSTAFSGELSAGYTSAFDGSSWFWGVSLLGGYASVDNEEPYDKTVSGTVMEVASRVRCSWNVGGLFDFGFNTGRVSPLVSFGVKGQFVRLSHATRVSGVVYGDEKKYFVPVLSLGAGAHIMLTQHWSLIARYMFDWSLPIEQPFDVVSATLVVGIKSHYAHALKLGVSYLF